MRRMNSTPATAERPSSSRLGAVLEENGLLVEPGDESALIGELARLLTSPGLRGGLARAGRRTVETRFSFAARMEAVRQVYDRLLGRASPVLRTTVEEATCVAS